MRSLRLEFTKLRRKHVAPVVFALVGAVLGWLYLDAHQEGAGSPTGWNSLLYAAPIMNSMLLSLLAAVVASRVADVDHEANAWKELLCLQRTGSLLAAKLLCAMLIMAFAMALEVAGMVAIGQLMNFPSMPDAATWGSFLASQLASCLFLVAIVGAVAIRWESQFISIACGLSLSLAGLFSSFLPTTLQRLIPSGYFTLLSTLRIDWTGKSLKPIFHTAAFPLMDYVLIALFTIAACAIAYLSFNRKEH